MLSEEKKARLIRQGYQLLNAQKGYSQRETVGKLVYLGYSTNVTAFNLINNEKSISTKALVILFDGMQVLLKKEICYGLNQGLIWQRLEGCQEETVKGLDRNELSKGFQVHPGGRLKIEEKVKFFNAAQKEVIEFGITLSTFSSYFISRSEATFKSHIIQLLKDGVNVKCYLLDPDWHGTHMYFTDREPIIKEGDTGANRIWSSLRKLKIISAEIAALAYPGQFEVFTYRHFPNNYFLAIDSTEKKVAKMMVSNYLFGERRADCPVMEITRKDQLVLYMRYLSSLQKIIKDAKRFDFTSLPE